MNKILGFVVVSFYCIHSSCVLAQTGAPIRGRILVQNLKNGAKKTISYKRLNKAWSLDIFGPTDTTHGYLHKLRLIKRYMQINGDTLRHQLVWFPPGYQSPVYDNAISYMINDSTLITKAGKDFNKNKSYYTYIRETIYRRDSITTTTKKNGHENLHIEKGRSGFDILSTSSSAKLLGMVPGGLVVKHTYYGVWDAENNLVLTDTLYSKDGLLMQVQQARGDMMMGMLAGGGAIAMLASPFALLIPNENGKRGDTALGLLVGGAVSLGIGILFALPTAEKRYQIVDILPK